MFILTLSGGEQEGAYSVTDPQGNQIYCIFLKSKMMQIDSV